MKSLLAAVLACVLSQAASAAVINSADVNGLRTFQDTNTGRVWLDLNNFNNGTTVTGTSAQTMIAAAQTAGFTFATYDDVAALLGSLPLATDAQWVADNAVMGGSLGRNIMWGAYNDDGASPYGYAWAYKGETSWNMADNMAYASVGYYDMGIFAYREGSVQNVPEPGSMVLLGLGLAGLAAVRRRRAA